LKPLQPAFANGQPPLELFDLENPILVVSAEGFPGVGALKDLIADGKLSGEPLQWVKGDRALAAYYPQAGALIESCETAAAAASKALEPGGRSKVISEPWFEAADHASARHAEDSLCAELPKSTDGYLARFDRHLSISLSRIFLRFPVTPNHITTASLILGLLGAWGLASGSYPSQVGGAILLWACCVLDGCDGEVARLKLLCSKSGAAYDLTVDHISHLATFVAIPLGVGRMNPQAQFLIPGILLLTGFLSCMGSVWWLILRRPENERGPLLEIIERLASRDYVYLILALSLMAHLDWFLWAAGLGSHIFNLSLWGLARYWKSPKA
jgi:phosphatidylglycerophosphate synthase